MELTPEEIADWKRMMSETTPTMVSPETYAAMLELLDRDPVLNLKLQALTQETPIWDEPHG